MKTLVLSLIAALAFSGPSYADEVDRSDPSATAVEFLKAYKARDYETVQSLFTAKNQEFFAPVVEEGEAHENHGEVFSGWRMESIDGWDGELLGDPRYLRSNAVVGFAEMPDDEIAVIMLSNEDGEWAVEDINSPSTAKYEKLSSEPK